MVLIIITITVYDETLVVCNIGNVINQTEMFLYKVLLLSWSHMSG